MIYDQMFYSFKNYPVINLLSTRTIVYQVTYYRSLEKFGVKKILLEAGYDKN